MGRYSWATDLMIGWNRILRPVRPRLTLVTELDTAAALQRIDGALGQPHCPIVGSVLERHVELLVRHDERHFWSPWLSAEVRPREAGSQLSGRFGPHPSLWTLFVALYAIWSFGAIGALVYGYVQWTLGHPASALWGLALAGSSALVQYAGSIVGQRLGEQQMETIRRFVSQAIDATADEA